jgi:hypothetical protein
MMHLLLSAFGGELVTSNENHLLVRLPVWLTPQGNKRTELQHNGAECRVRTEAPPPHPWRSLRSRLRSGNVMLAHNCRRAFVPHA